MSLFFTYLLRSSCHLFKVWQEWKAPLISLHNSFNWLTPNAVMKWIVIHLHSKFTDPLSLSLLSQKVLLHGWRTLNINFSFSGTDRLFMRSSKYGGGKSLFSPPQVPFLHFFFPFFITLTFLVARHPPSFEFYQQLALDNGHEVTWCSWCPFLHHDQRLHFASTLLFILDDRMEWQRILSLWHQN